MPLPCPRCNHPPGLTPGAAQVRLVRTQGFSPPPGPALAAASASASSSASTASESRSSSAAFGNRYGTGYSSGSGSSSGGRGPSPHGTGAAGSRSPALKDANRGSGPARHVKTAAGAIAAGTVAAAAVAKTGYDHTASAPIVEVQPIHPAGDEHVDTLGFEDEDEDDDSDPYSCSIDDVYN